MTDRSKKITELPAASSVIPADLLLVVKDTAGTPNTHKVTAANLFANVTANTVLNGRVTLANTTTISGSVNLTNTFSVGGTVTIAANGAWVGNSSGLKGEVGSKGDKGELGGSGDKGQKGDYGQDGSKGDKGESSTGSAGSKGDKGDTGTNGTSGTKGDKGDAGAAGTKGDTGTNGTNGTNGSKGDKGDTGTAGAKGDTGTSGTKGDKGDTGTGTKGDKGDATGGIVMPVDENFTVTTSHTVVTDHIYDLTDDYIINIEISPGTTIAGWSQRNQSEIEVDLFVDTQSSFYTYLSGLTVGRDAEITYATSTGNAVFTSTVSQAFTGTGQGDPESGWARMAGRVLGTLPTNYVSDPGILHVNFPVTTEPTNVLTYDSLGKIVVATNTDLTISTRSIQPSASPAIDQTSSWEFSADGRLTIPGRIAVPEYNTTWTSNVLSVSFGSHTEVTLEGEIFGGSDTGQILITGVTGTVQLNALWYYQAVEASQIRLFGTPDRSANVDSTGWTAFAGGGIAENLMPGMVNVHVSSYTWQFNPDGTTKFPSNVINAGDQSIDLKSSQYAELWYHANTNTWHNDPTYNSDTYVYTEGDGTYITHIRADDDTNPTWEHTWGFKNDGSLTYPTLQTNSRTGSADALVFKKTNNQKAIATQSGNSSVATVERLVIAGGDSYRDPNTQEDAGEGGDVYLWAGRGANGGDIKIDAGESTGASGQEGGTIKIRGGYSANGTGGFANIEAGDGVYGGDINLFAGTGAGGSGATIRLYGGGGEGSSNNTSTTSGDIEIIAGTDAGWSSDANIGNIKLRTQRHSGEPVSEWKFDTNGILTLPDGAVMGTVEGNNAHYFGIATAANTGFLIEANNGSQVWEFNRDGTTQFPNNAIRSAANVNVETLSTTLTPSNWDGAGGWNQGYYSDLATTGGSGTGLTVDVAAGGGGYINISAITIHTPGSGYVVGDVITITNENSLSGTFTLTAVPNVWTFNTNGITKIPHGANNPSTARGAAGDKAGMILVSGAYLFYCYADYTDGSVPIWQKVAMDNTDWD